MRFISFFAGIGGIDLGLERASHVCVGQVEIDPFCNRVLAKHWPDVPRWGDIREVDPNELPEADLWAGGFPCQDISNAGKREGIRGTRSGLFFDWMRTVRVVRPSRLLLENVAALLGRGMGEVQGELAEGWYDTEWDCVSARAVGAPHIRERVFIFAERRADRSRSRCGRAMANAGCVRERDADESALRGSDSAGAGTGGEDVADAPESDGFGDGTEQQRQGSFGVRGSASRLAGFRDSVGADQWATEPDVGRVAHGVPSRIHRLRALGNAVVPQVAEFIGRLLAQAEAAP